MKKLGNKLDDKFKQNIDSYSKRIVTLKDFITAVRKMPGMYCAGRGNTGFLSLIREIYQNSLDQILEDESPATSIDLYYNESTLEVIESDNGMGFPFSDMVRMVTSHHTSKNYSKQKGQYSSVLHGSGLKVVNALSTKCTIESYHYSGAAKRLDLEEGYVIKEPYDIPNKECKQGSTVRFIPSTEVLGELTLDWKVVYTLIKQLLSLAPIGSEVNFCAIDLNGVEHREHLVNKDGIITELIANVKNPLCKPILISEDTGEMKLDLAFTYDGEISGENERITSFCNMCPTMAGHHITGTIDGITRWFCLYMNNIYLSNNKKKLKVLPVDIHAGLNIMISAACLEPTFNGQAKEILDNPEMGPFCKDIVMKGLDQWSKNNPSDLSRLARYFKDIAELRMKEEGEKQKIVKKYQANVLTGYPANYTRPTKRKGELFIVEGDSAGGSAKEARDPTYQAIFKIRGKIKSAYKHSYKEFMSNPEVQGLTTVFLDQKPYTRKFDPYKDCPWEKIIIMADADVDGSHIATLILRMMVLYFPQLIEAGKVYKALPPLYGLKDGKKIKKYFIDQLAFAQYIQKYFSQSNVLTHLDGSKVSTKDITLFLMRNEDYIHDLESLAQTYAVDPRLLELSLFAYYNKTAFPTMKKELTKEFRFMNLQKENNTLVYEGIIGDSNTLFVNDRLIKDCKNILNIIQKNESLYYGLNGKTASIYQIMKEFDKSTPNGIQRYKGLGEMDADQLAVSTLRPENRTLIRYTIQDVKEETEIIREYEMDKSKLFPLIGTVRRQDLLD